MNPPLVFPEKIFLSPLHIKLGLTKNFVKGIDKASCGFEYLRNKLPNVSDAKIKEGIVYSRIGKIISVDNSILFDGENISFDASLVMYMNSTSIPPIIIMNRMYKNQNLLYIVPMIRHTIVVWINNISPMGPQLGN